MSLGFIHVHKTFSISRIRSLPSHSSNSTSLYALEFFFPFFFFFWNYMALPQSKCLTKRNLFPTLAFFPTEDKFFNLPDFFTLQLKNVLLQHRTLHYPNTQNSATPLLRHAQNWLGLQKPKVSCLSGNAAPQHSGGDIHRLPPFAPARITQQGLHQTDFKPEAPVTTKLLAIPGPLGKVASTHFKEQTRWLP